MLQEKLYECRILIEEISQNKKVDSENKEIARKNNTFFDAYNSYFVPTIKSYIICKNCTHISFSANIQGEIKKWADYSKKIFEQKKIIDSPLKYREGVKKMSEKIETEWREQTEDFLSTIKEELEILKLISNSKQEIQKILVGLNDFSKWPIEKDIYEQYEISYRRAKEILVKMKFDDNDEVRVFLKKVKDKKATLLDLTDTIIEWVRQENLAGNILLNLKN